MPPKMSQAHKDALAEGRRDAHAVRRYLEYLATKSDGRTARHNTPEVLQERVDAKQQELNKADGVLEEVKLKSELAELQDRLDKAVAEASIDVDQLRRDFEHVAGRYSESHGINRKGWQAMGVPNDVLTNAGL